MTLGFQRRFRSAITILALGGVGALLAGASVPDGKKTEPAASSLGSEAPTTSFQYMGIKKCRMCHVDQFASFDQSSKAKSWEALRPGVGVEVKKQSGLDPAADFTKDERCLKCHSTGFGEPGGYVIPEPTNKVSVATAASREGVGCESCHGPGSGFVEHMKDISDKERGYRREELLSAGLRASASETCGKCHNADALCQKGRSNLEVNPTDRRGYHAQNPLKFRASTDSPAPPTPKP